MPPWRLDLCPRLLLEAIPTLGAWPLRPDVIYRAWAWAWACLRRFMMMPGRQGYRPSTTPSSHTPDPDSSVADNRKSVAGDATLSRTHVHLVTH